MDWAGNPEDARREMLAAAGVAGVEEFLTAIPRRIDGLLNLPPGMSEHELVRHMNEVASANAPVGAGRSFLGAGAFEHAIPAAIESLISRGEFLTAYTPYQAEASQGTLTAIFEFQTMISRITAMDVANASMYDGPSAMAEAALLALRKTKRSRVIVSGAAHPQWREVVRTYLSGIEAALVETPLSGGVTNLDGVLSPDDQDAACLIVQQPNFFGQLEDLDALREAAKACGALFIVAANPLALGLLKPPGEAGADIAVGDCQPLGIPLNYGGPYAGYFAVRGDLMRQMPGRLAGMAWDAEGRRGFTLTLQAREQHIRRERATSNICTNQALLALSSTIYLSLVGRAGFQEIARQNAVLSHFAADTLAKIPGVSLAFDGPFFNEFALRLPMPAAEVNRRLLERGYWAGFDLGRCCPGRENELLVCVTETKTADDIESFASALAEVLS